MGVPTMPDTFVSVTPELAEKLFDVLVTYCGKYDDPEARRDFITCPPHARFDSFEYRFIGALDFSGKIYLNPFRWYVSCYQEDLTPERMMMMGQANCVLAALFTYNEVSKTVA